MRLPVLRRITIALIVALVLAGLIFHTGTGTLSSFGWKEIAAICPLGIIEVFLAEKTLIPRVLVVLLLAVVLGAVLGKVFCAWACPVPLLRRIFAFGQRRRLAQKTASVATVMAAPQSEAAEDSPAPARCASDCSGCVEKRARLDSRHVVLGGALLSAAVFGFPVFCLICPVGLCFATIIAFWRWIGFDELTFSLLVFPAILAIEILVLRKWCLRFCPLGALFSLMSLPNRFLRPAVDEGICLRNRGIDCSICVEVCTEGLDPHFKDGMHECSKCGECLSRCPVHAIRMPFKTPQENQVEHLSNPTVPPDSAS
jgi:ferredoxin-type protein NapH